jgi:hypothetical protein
MSREQRDRTDLTSRRRKLLRYDRGYNLSANNCGMTTSRVADRLDLSTTNSIALSQYHEYVIRNWRPYIPFATETPRKAFSTAE